MHIVNSKVIFTMITLQKGKNYYIEKFKTLLRNYTQTFMSNTLLFNLNLWLIRYS